MKHFGIMIGYVSSLMLLEISYILSFYSTIPLFSTLAVLRQLFATYVTADQVYIAIFPADLLIFSVFIYFGLLLVFSNTNELVDNTRLLGISMIFVAFIPLLREIPINRFGIFYGRLAFFSQFVFFLLPFYLVWKLPKVTDRQKTYRLRLFLPFAVNLLFIPADYLVKLLYYGSSPQFSQSNVYNFLNSSIAIGYYFVIILVLIFLRHLVDPIETKSIAENQSITFPKPSSKQPA